MEKIIDITLDKVTDYKITGYITKQYAYQQGKSTGTALLVRNRTTLIFIDKK